MSTTNIPCTPTVPFQGNMVISMRPMIAADGIKAVQITGKLPQVHGTQVHLGDFSLIGLTDVTKPDFGDAVRVLSNEIPVFWACGVTPQSVVFSSKPEFNITHYFPGSMLVTDMKENGLANL
ncbi:DUF1445-domain-containing protein [Gonapodya prolifera JEL478]|uniref:DUF1445-domain-containing protein n=1 Tax=Gonapodya prolifera (strain JEL478) TaxID=1344416 RepID=A0A138ZXS9_GONPJ|nr:DUF1445-domain-containing protein [Gonapodya prolifera JEL478]|eukprot:KXS09307.1 DUF1445-domain-containing protein [Gonapodya prolifera JEL478]